MESATCPICDRVFSKVTFFQIYCCSNCRSVAFRLNKKQRKREEFAKRIAALKENTTPRGV